MKKLFLCFALILSACAAPPPTAPKPTCTLFKVSAAKIFADGEYKSQFLTRKIGTTAYMLLQVKGDSMRAWTEDAYSRPAEPETGAEAFMPWDYDGSYLRLDGFMPLLTVLDTVTFVLRWQDSEFNMKWKRPLQVPVSIREPRPPDPGPADGSSSCPE